MVVYSRKYNSVCEHVGIVLADATRDWFENRLEVAEETNKYAYNIFFK